ncbi:ATP-binding protein [Bradyrhizobium sp. ISRA443]|uniref:sensor histidine kinase n=1 Tax=unclassified Bradyrhizobium TaxID=2631580 RepID=UPI00247B180F|nr:MULTISPECIES: ATP-binding protein [unclassified Bradyrhizobium]WGR96418.1 ATP-binding protein [Bradyrhizobium sp. ISRA436]WGS03303.1 ATP-binding protein [Bradyrhizobium sp. ISRA437]WGS10187.1 ATP-binding protein [Bradyrhizobium sp. ISRA443]
MRFRPPNVRTRLTLWHAGVLTLIICIFSAAILLFVQTRLYAALDAQLGLQIATIGKVYREEPDELADLASEWGITLFRVDDAGGIRQQTEAWAREGLSSPLQPGDSASPLSWTAPSGRRYRVHSFTGSTYRVAAAIDETSLRDTLWTLAVILATGIPFAAGLAVAGGYFLAGRVLAPVGAMAQKAREITAESLAKRLPVDNARDEFGQLATVFNDTLFRLQDAFERLRRFAADASHELRTPLTAMRSVGEVALQSPLDAVAYRDVIGSMLEEVDRLTRLVESLLILTRADSGKIHLVPEDLDLGRLAGNVIDQLHVLADEKRQELTLRVPIRVHATADAALIRHALMNLIHNAIKYTPNGGAITVEVNATAKRAVIEVRDTGPGIPTAHRDRIFDRFYRVDASRSREEGGVGLGLAIARWAVEANGGQIELASEATAGSLFRVMLPAADDSSAAGGHSQVPCELRRGTQEAASS